MHGASAINGSFSLSHLLINRGHEVIYVGYEGDRKYIEEQEFKFHTFDISPFVKQQETAGSHLKSISRFRFGLRQSLRVIEHLFDQAECWIRELRPDLVLLDANNLDFSVPFIDCNVPIINVSCTLSSFYAAGRPPVFSALIPSAEGAFFSKLKADLAWKKLFLKQRYREIIFGAFLRIGFGTEKYTSIQTRVGQSGIELARTEYGPRLRVPQIILGPQCLDFPRKNDSNKIWYTDACVDEHRKEPEIDLSFLQKEKTLIYCAMGTCSRHYDAINLYRCLYAVMRDLPDCQLVLQTANTKDVDKCGVIPENVRVFESVPQIEMLKRASLFITHGGFASFREGVYFAKPMIVFPGWHDQPGNAARVEFHKLGRRGSMRTIKASQLLQMIRQVLSDQTISSSLRDMQKNIRDDRDLYEAISLIENYGS